MDSFGDIEFRKVFKGRQLGIGLSEREPGDLHVIVTLLSSDDGNWFVSENGFSAYWLKDLEEVLEEVQVYLEKACTKSKFGEYTWKHKKDHF